MMVNEFRVGVHGVRKRNIFIYIELRVAESKEADDTYEAEDNKGE